VEEDKLADAPVVRVDARLDALELRDGGPVNVPGDEDDLADFGREILEAVGGD
jgi:hypothetical protein